MSKEKHDVVIKTIDGEKLEFWIPKTEKELQENLEQVENSKKTNEDLIEQRQQIRFMPIEEEHKAEIKSLKKDKKMNELEIDLIQKKLKALKLRKED